MNEKKGENLTRKLAVNILKLTGGKNEKPRQGVLHEKLWLDLCFVYRKH